MDVKEKFEGKGQVLLDIEKKRNKYELVTPEVSRLQTATEEEAKLIRTRDIDAFYGDQGE